MEWRWGVEMAEKERESKGGVEVGVVGRGGKSGRLDAANRRVGPLRLPEIAPREKTRPAKMHVQGFICIDCGVHSPPTDEGETVTKKYAWRVTRRIVAGVVHIDPRCPECAARHRASKGPGKM